MKAPKIKNEGIHNVPTEIWFQIIHEIDTVANLGKLFYLFPMARPAFALLDAHSFLDVLLEEGRGTCQNTNDMIRTCVLLKAGHMPIDAEQFHNGFIRESMRPYARHWTTIYGWTPRELDRKANVSTLISVLKTAYIIDCATVECLDFYLDKFRSLKLQRPKFWREKAKSPYGENMGYVEWTANAWTPKRRAGLARSMMSDDLIGRRNSEYLVHCGECNSFMRQSNILNTALCFQTSIFLTFKAVVLASVAGG